MIDECHRGSANDDSAWKEILEYFDGAIQLGLTATPKETKYASNITYFGEPVYTYSLKQGIVSQDDYYLPIEQQVKDANGKVNFDLPGALDLDLLAEDLRCLASGEAVYRQEYNFNMATEPRWMEIRPARVILVEGLFLLQHPGLRELFDLKVFVEASEEIQLSRRTARDGRERGYAMADGFTLRAATAPTTTVVRVHFSPYWQLERGTGCVEPAPGDWTRVRLRSAGTAHVGMDFSLGRIRATSPRCNP